jgi:hypothetical protein
MRHATEQDLASIAPLLAQLRDIAGLNERKPGIFYWKSRAFLHFHEHEGTLHADVRLGGSDFERFALESAAACRQLIAAIRQHLAVKR